MRTLFLLALMTSSLASLAQTITNTTLGPQYDATTSTATPSTPNGSATTMTVTVTTSGGTNYTRSFIKMDLSTIPPNAVITSAILKLSPNGTENVSATNATELTLEISNNSWDESVTHSMGIAPNTLYAAAPNSNLVSGKREFDVQAHVQAFVDNRLPNYGWRLRRTSETTAASTTYHAREGLLRATDPILDISYYTPVSITGATIVHASTLTAQDGSITPTVSGGSSASRTYTWYNSLGTQIQTGSTIALSGKPYGWYGLKIVGSHATDVTYYAFLIGVKCEVVNINFNPGANYIDDAMVYDLKIGTGNAQQNYGYLNNGGISYVGAEQWTNTNWYNLRSLMRFRLWVPSDMNVQEAKVNLTGLGHSPLHRSNISELTRVITNNWKESGISEYNRPPQTATGALDVAATPAGNQNATVDIASFYNLWKANNLQNYGVYLQLKSYLDPVVSGGTYTRMKYQSSDNTSAPTVDFKVDVFGAAVCTPFAQLNYELDGYYYIMKNGLIKFVYNQEYETANLKFNIYNSAGTLFRTQAHFPAVSTTNGDNYITLDASSTNCIGPGYFYLEVINSKGEKTYLRFYNDYSGCTVPVFE